jgi:hypothetical protein
VNNIDEWQGVSGMIFLHPCSIFLILLIFFLQKFNQKTYSFHFGETLLTPLNFRGFCRHLPNIYIKLWFSLTLPLPYRKSFAMPILPLTPKLYHSQVDIILVLESGVKLALH